MGSPVPWTGWRVGTKRSISPEPLDVDGSLEADGSSEADGISSTETSATCFAGSGEEGAGAESAPLDRRSTIWFSVRNSPS